MSEFQESVMVALLPTTSDWCKIELPHMTLVYVGEIPDLPVTLHNTLAKTAIDIAQEIPPQTLDVIGTDILGKEKLVDVLLLRSTPEVVTAYNFLQQWDATEYRFKPHCTVGPMGSLPDKTPTTLTFDRILVSWGEQNLVYPLTRRVVL